MKNYKFTDVCARARLREVSLLLENPPGTRRTQTRRERGELRPGYQRANKDRSVPLWAGHRDVTGKLAREVSMAAKQ